jgi:hypothetical protein
MRLDIVSIMPESLEQAEQQYRADIERRGYSVIGTVEAHWQGRLFGDTMDAIVSGQVRKKRKE